MKYYSLIINKKTFKRNLSSINFIFIVVVFFHAKTHIRCNRKFKYLF
jgi:hypothetical protein